MSSLTRTMLPAFALAAMMSVAQAQTTPDQDHNAHHPAEQGVTQTQSAPAPAPAPAQPTQGTQPGMPGNAPMMGQGMGSGMIVQPGTQAQGGQPGMGQSGMMMNMDQMRSMMGGMMGRQDGQAGMMRPDMTGDMGSMHGGMNVPFEHVEGRIAFLKAELGITEAQQPQWSAFADALRSTAKAQQSMHERMMSGAKPASWPERLALQQQVLSTRLDAVKTLEAAAKPLYGVLTEEQKTLADRLLSGPMGMM